MQKFESSERVAAKWLPIAGAIVFGCAFLALGISEAVKYGNPAYWEYRKIQEQERTKRNRDFFVESQEADSATVTSSDTDKLDAKLNIRIGR